MKPPSPQANQACTLPRSTRHQHQVRHPEPRRRGSARPRPQGVRRRDLLCRPGVDLVDADYVAAILQAVVDD